MKETARGRPDRLAVRSKCAGPEWGRTDGQTTNRPPARCGFTLLETLIAIFVLGLILSAVYGSYRAVTVSMADLQPRIALDQQGRFFAQRLSRQIRCCYGGRRDQGTRSSLGQKDVPPIASPEEEMCLFRGSPTMSDDVILQFATTSSALSRKSSLGCLSLISYKVDTSQHALLTCEEAYGRRGRDDERSWRVVLENLREITFGYFDGVDWQTRWDSSLAGGLPKAVRIRLVLQAQQESVPRCLMVVVPVRCSTLGRFPAEVPESPQAEADRKK
jgi:prepilin-type N-terminal cleavage/methylation domain-containing protein